AACRQPAAIEDHCPVQCRESVGPVRNDDDDALFVAEGFDRADERILAIRIKIGIGFIENDEEWATEYSPRQTDPLSLPGRQRRAPLAEPSVIAIGQAQDHVMRPG